MDTTENQRAQNLPSNLGPSRRFVILFESFIRRTIFGKRWPKSNILWGENLLYFLRCKRLSNKMTLLSFQNVFRAVLIQAVMPLSTNNLFCEAYVRFSSLMSSTTQLCRSESFFDAPETRKTMQTR